MFTPKAPPKAQKGFTPKSKSQRPEIEFDYKNLSITLLLDGRLDIYSKNTDKKYIGIFTHINYHEVKDLLLKVGKLLGRDSNDILYQSLIAGMDDPLIQIKSEDWKEIKEIAQKYLDNKTFL